MPFIINEDCIACGTCIDECPVDAIVDEDRYFIDSNLCMECGVCSEVCPVEAIIYINSDSISNLNRKQIDTTKTKEGRMHQPEIRLSNDYNKKIKSK